MVTSGFTWYIYYRSPALKFFSEQHSYEDKMVFHSHTYRHELTMVQWKKYYWLFMDGLKNLSSADDYLFYEPTPYSRSFLLVLDAFGIDDLLLRKAITEEDILKLAGTSIEETRSPGPLRTAWIRFPWLYWGAREVGWTRR